MPDLFTKPTLVLIDGHSQIHRAYHGIKASLTNSKGEPTGAVFTFLNVFQRMQKQIDFHHVVVVFDPPGPSFRKEMYAEYKANRQAAPEDLLHQEQRIREMLRLMQVPVLEVPGFEADDVLACLAVKAVESGGEALVCSVDKDLMQIVRPGIKIWRDHLQKIEVLDEQGVIEKTGVRPDQIPAYLGLMGDTSDNIPGVPGVGQKTAAALLQEHGTIEAILAAAPTLKSKKISQALQEHAEAARLSERLATLNYKCHDGFDWEQYRWDYKPTPELREFFRVMEFQAQLEEMQPEAKPLAERSTNYATITTRAELEAAVASIRQAGICAIDTETDSLEWLDANLVGISLSWEANQAVYIPVGHHGGEPQLSLEDARAVLAPALADPSITWVAHHWSYDYKILKRAGFEPGNVGSDTMIAAYLINPERTGALRLKELAVQWLGIRMTEIKELIGEGDDLMTMAGVTVAQTAPYACQDADATLQLHHALLAQVREAGMEDLYRRVELPLIPVLADMELEGVRIDHAHFRNLSIEADKELARLAEEIYAIAGRVFKINSPKQVGEILFDELKLPSQKKGKSGAYSTDVTVLEALQDQHPLPAKLLEYRQVEKLKTTYIDSLPSLVHPRTGRIHTSFNQTIAATGRLSSSNPNLQNIPVRTDAGRQIRQGFIRRAEGWKFVTADYSQIELRILAHISGDKVLRDAFQSGGDIHTLTASQVFKVAPEAVTKTQRNYAKTINFGIIYGMSDFRLARQLEISRETARHFIEDYFRIYSGIHNYLETTKEKARRDGFVTTLLGRRRFVPEINSRNANIRGAAERVATNTPIQGTSADMIKLAMIRVAERLKRDEFRSRMILQVHDELIFDCPEEEYERLAVMVKEEMANALPLDVPVKVEVAAADNWAESK